MRIIGYSPSGECLVTVIVLAHQGTVYGANGWRANNTDHRRYQEGQP